MTATRPSTCPILGTFNAFTISRVQLNIEGLIARIGKAGAQAAATKAAQCEQKPVKTLSNSPGSSERLIVIKEYVISHCWCGAPLSGPAVNRLSSLTQPNLLSARFGS